MADDKNKKADDGSLEEPSTLIQPEQPAENIAETSAQDEGSLTEPSGSDDSDTSKNKPPKRLFNFVNLYLVIFILLLVLAAGGIFAAVKFNDKNSNSGTSKTDSLTSKQISDLKNNTTLVGDAQQTLDIQGNSIFEGQVLMRNNLDVAGSIKIGGSLSLPAITVGGTSNFGQIHVNDQLSVSGNTILQGTLTAQKGLNVTGQSSFGSLSASQITVSNLQLTGDFVISRHISANGGTPGRSGGSALGAGGTASVSGSDTAGTVTVSTGGGPGAGCFITMNFVNRFNTTPHVVISPSNSSAGTLQYYTNRSNTNFSICTASAPSGSTTYLFDYIVFD